MYAWVVYSAGASDYDHSLFLSADGSGAFSTVAIRWGPGGTCRVSSGRYSTGYILLSHYAQAIMCNATKAMRALPLSVDVCCFGSLLLLSMDGRSFFCYV
jgi:hypothetical protein